MLARELTTVLQQFLLDAGSPSASSKFDSNHAIYAFQSNAKQKQYAHSRDIWDAHSRDILLLQIGMSAMMRSKDESWQTCQKSLPQANIQGAKFYLEDVIDEAFS